MKSAKLGLRMGAVLVGLLLLGAFPVGAEEDATGNEVTFYKDVLPILQDNCQSCHRSGGDNLAGMVAPMSFTTYREVRPWVKSIATNVQKRNMPPWYAGPEFHGVFSNERTLSEEEIATLVRWARSGARRGQPEDAPDPPVFSGEEGWFNGKPELVVEMSEPYFVADEVDDVYVSLSSEPIPEELLPRDRWLRSIEWQGGSDAVHHVGSTAIVEHDDGTVIRVSLGTTAPGEEPPLFPEGHGKLLPKGARITFSMHYHKEKGPGTGVWDQSRIGFRFWDEEKDPPIVHPVYRGGASNGSFEIPPGHPNWLVGASRRFDKDSTLLSLHPHMHLRGKDARYVAIYPDGRRETLLEVPNYNFNWQLDYYFADPKRIPAGTRVEFSAHYDNSSDNVNNPDSTIPMGWGGPTTMEMMIGYIQWTDTEPVDPKTAHRIALGQALAAEADEETE